MKRIALVSIIFLGLIGLLAWFDTDQETRDSSTQSHKSDVIQKVNPNFQTSPSNPTEQSEGSAKSPQRGVAQAQSHSKLEKLQKILKSFDSEAQWLVNQGPQGQVTTISGGLIRVDLSTPEKALIFARSVGQAIGLKPEQLEISQSSLPETPDTKSIRVVQKFEGYEVRGAYLDLFQRKKDGATYFITNEALPLNDVDTRIQRTLQEAQDALVELYPNQTVKVERSLPEPLILNVGPEKGELCWQIQVQITGAQKLEKKLLFLSAKNLALIHSQNLLHRN